MIAVGAYLRTLREARNLTREAVADAVNTSVSQLVRIENGEQDTRGSLLFRIVATVRGDVEQVNRLMLSETATPDEGREQALVALHNAIEESGARPHLQTPEDVAELMRLFEEELTVMRVEDRRSLSDQLRGFLAGFRSARRRSGEPPDA